MYLRQNYCQSASYLKKRNITLFEKVPKFYTKIVNTLRYLISRGIKFYIKKYGTSQYIIKYSKIKKKSCRILLSLYTDAHQLIPAGTVQVYHAS